MIRETVSLEAGASLDTLRDACDTVVRAGPWEVLGSWTAVGPDRYQLRVMNRPLPAHLVIPGMSATPSAVTFECSGVGQKSRCDLVGERQAEGPTEEYLLREQLITLYEAIAGAVAPSAAHPSIFLSYRRDDSGYVTDDVSDRLRARFGRSSVFKDTADVPLGVDFRHRLESVLGHAKVLLAMIGKDWLGDDGSNARRLWHADDYVRLELETALDRGLPVIPVFVRGAEMPEAQSLSDSLQRLRQRNGLSLRRDRDFDADFERLASRIGEILGTE